MSERDGLVRVVTWRLYRVYDGAMTGAVTLWQAERVLAVTVLTEVAGVQCAKTVTTFATMLKDLR